MNGKNFTYNWKAEPEILDVVDQLESQCYLRDQMIAEAAMKVTLRKQDEINHDLLSEAWQRTVGP